MKTYPMFFNAGGLVAGTGFIARVSIKGRCLVEETGENYISFFGLNPAAVASDGSDLDQAYRAFVDRIRLIVFDIADESKDFDDFARRVREFVEEDADRRSEEEWTEAVHEVREGRLNLEGFEKRNADEEEIGVEVERVQRPEESLPSLNNSPEWPRMAA